MRIIIGGAGRVGTDLAKALRAEDIDVVLVDSDSRAVKNAQNLDVLVIHGDLTKREKLHEAGIGHSSVFVAATKTLSAVSESVSESPSIAMPCTTLFTLTSTFTPSDASATSASKVESAPLKVTFAPSLVPSSFTVPTLSLLA